MTAWNWLGLDYDEGPYYQTERFERYREVIAQLVDQGDAYYCDCSRERLDALREQQMAAKQKPRYDGHLPRTRSVGAGEGQCCALSQSARWRRSFLVTDVKGESSGQPTDQLDDLIIERSDGSPTYNLSVVVDDMDMQITHVIRGDDHVNNTPRQVNILQRRWERTNSGVCPCADDSRR